MDKSLQGLPSSTKSKGPHCMIAKFKQEDLTNEPIRFVSKNGITVRQCVKVHGFQKMVFHLEALLCNCTSMPGFLI